MRLSDTLIARRFFTLHGLCGLVPMAHRSLCALCVLLPLLLPLQVVPQGFDLQDALDGENDKPLTPAPPKKEAAPAGGAGGDFDLEDYFKDVTPTKAPPKVFPRVPKVTKAPAKPKPKPAADDFDLADALDSKNDNKDKDKNEGKRGVLSDDDLADLARDDTYKPDDSKAKGKGQGQENTAEVGTIAGFASVVAMALVGAVSSYISYQKKKLCFSIQQSLNTDILKTENPEAVVATEPQVQQTLLEPPSAEPRTEENAV